MERTDQVFRATRARADAGVAPAMMENALANTGNDRCRARGIAAPSRHGRRTLPALLSPVSLNTEARWPGRKSLSMRSPFLPGRGYRHRSTLLEPFSYSIIRAALLRKPPRSPCHALKRWPYLHAAIKKGSGSAGTLGNAGGPRRIRTFDQKIKSSYNLYLKTMI